MDLIERTTEAPESAVPDLSSKAAYLLPAARKIVRDHQRIPSARHLQRALRTRFETAAEVRAVMVTEYPELPEAPVSPAAPNADAYSEDTAAYPMLPGPRPARIDTPAGERPAESTREQDTAPVESAPVKPRPKLPGAWPLFFLSLPAFVAVWSGWVGVGSMTGFGIVHPLPGIWDSFQLNTAITLPIGLETYAAFAIRIWLSAAVSDRTRKFARASALGALALGAGGQIAYHLMAAAGIARAPWEITTVVSAIPILVVFAGAALAHLVRADRAQQ
jgi:hypothetical protein